MVTEMRKKLRPWPDSRDFGAGFVAGGGAAVGVAAAEGSWLTVLVIGMALALLALVGSTMAASSSKQGPAARKALAKQMLVLGCALWIITLALLAKNGFPS